MTKDEALKLALEALESSRVFVTTREKIKHPEGTEWYDQAITAIKEALAQPEQEPVAWMYVNTDGECEQIEYGEPFDDPSTIPLYTTPPKHTWVGLTDEEVMVWTGPPTNNPPRDDKKYWVRGKLVSTEMHGGSMRANVMTPEGMYNPELSRVFTVEQDVAEGLKSMYHNAVAKHHGRKADDAFDNGDEEGFKKSMDKHISHKLKAGEKIPQVRDAKKFQQGVSGGYILKKTNIYKYVNHGDTDVKVKNTDYEIINNKTGQPVGTASWTTNDYFGPGALEITMNNGATRYLDIWERERGNPQTAFNRFVKDPKTAKKY